jgi:hypothetical protein
MPRKISRSYLLLLHGASLLHSAATEPDAQHSSFDENGPSTLELRSLSAYDDSWYVPAGLSVLLRGTFMHAYLFSQHCPFSFKLLPLDYSVRQNDEIRHFRRRRHCINEPRTPCPSGIPPKVTGPAFHSRPTRWSIISFGTEVQHWQGRPISGRQTDSRGPGGVLLLETAHKDPACSIRNPQDTSRSSSRDGLISPLSFDCEDLMQVRLSYRRQEETVNEPPLAEQPS